MTRMLSICRARPPRVVKRLAAAVISCGLLLTPVLVNPGLAAASTPDPAVWVGSPVNGRWPNRDDCAGAVFPSDLCSLPTVHHAVYPSSFDWGTSWGGDWAADDQGVYAGERVMLYAAPVNSGYNPTAHVDTVGPACRSGVIAYGGYRVTIGIYVGSTKIGTVTYAHINPTVYQGQWISRWGSRIGTVGSYTSNSCWAGPHVHVEMTSRHNYSCFSNIFTRYPGANLWESNFQGYLGGYYAGGPRQACA
ncbi:hypothetical protein [Pedococcus sp. 2YAF34]|uniref:hypothetical protein n=1 Tax=Pedococcus sp. 2YAF34 TaxID=3233032 RepID=UPI003F94A7A8